MYVLQTFAHFSIQPKSTVFCYHQLIVEAGGWKIVNEDEGKWKMPRDNFRVKKQQRETSNDKNVNTDEQIRMYIKVNTAAVK